MTTTRTTTMSILPTLAARRWTWTWWWEEDEEEGEIQKLCWKRRVSLNYFVKFYWKNPIYNFVISRKLPQVRGPNRQPTSIGCISFSSFIYWIVDQDVSWRKNELHCKVHMRLLPSFYSPIPIVGNSNNYKH